VLALGYDVSDLVIDQYVSTCLYLRYTIVITEKKINSTNVMYIKVDKSVCYEVQVLSARGEIIQSKITDVERK
jgi:hypothetical protein